MSCPYRKYLANEKSSILIDFSEKYSREIINIVIMTVNERTRAFLRLLCIRTIEALHGGSKEKCH